MYCVLWHGIRLIVTTGPRYTVTDAEEGLVNEILFLLTFDVT